MSDNDDSVKRAPVSEKDLITIAFSREELSTLTSLLSISAQTFRDLADQAIIENKEGAYAVLYARQKLSAMYASKLSEALMIGEPESKDYH